MKALDGCTRLASLNDCAVYPRILAGGLSSLEIDGREIAVAIGPLLARSAPTLRSIEAR